MTKKKVKSQKKVKLLLSPPWPQKGQVYPKDWVPPPPPSVTNALVMKEVADRDTDIKLLGGGITLKTLIDRSLKETPFEKNYLFIKKQVNQLKDKFEKDRLGIAVAVRKLNSILGDVSGRIKDPVIREQLKDAGNDMIKALDEVIK